MWTSISAPDLCRWRLRADWASATPDVNNATWLHRRGAALKEPPGAAGARIPNNGEVTRQIVDVIVPGEHAMRNAELRGSADRF